MKKGVSFVWDNACKNAFEDIKEYLTHPPILGAPVSRKLFQYMFERWIIPWVLYSLKTMIKTMNMQSTI